ncbi:MAG TPA: hypothetical protein DCQ76_03325 [Ruminococcaceae bacterium]|nr:hypothetical protein [Oscillospiraceae bacterium]
MNIHKSRGDRVIVEISSNELSRYELCPEEMDCKNPKTRRLINDVMLKAQKELRRDITSFDKMSVDVMETDEGCIIILCFKGGKNKKPFSGYICVMPQTDDIFKLAEGLLPHREKIRQASLFADDKNYAVCVLPYAVYSRDIFFVLSEFGDTMKAPTGTSEYFLEHKKLISRDFISSLTS